MEVSREKMREEVLTLLRASRELSPGEDQELAITFVSHLDSLPRHPNREGGPRRLVYAFMGVLAVLLAIPIVMVTQTYSNLDGYLPRPDAGALPLVYWLALATVILVLVACLVSERTGWRLKVTRVRESPR